MKPDINYLNASVYPATFVKIEIFQNVPTNRAQLIRYLTDNPYMISQFNPAAPLVKRKFIRMQANSFVIATSKGEESYLDAKASDITFDDNGFTVSNPDFGSNMRYNYTNKILIEVDDELHRIRQAEIEDSRKRAEIDKQKKDAEKSRKSGLFNGFLDGMTDLRKGKAEVTLSKLIRCKGVVINYAKYIEDMVNEGYSIRIFRGYWGHKSVKLIEMDILEEPNGGSCVSEKEITKTGMDYAKFLIELR